MRNRAAGATPSRDPQAHTAGQATRRVPLRAVRTGRLRTRLLLTVTGLVVLISLVSGLSTVLVVSRQLRRQLERQGEILAAQLARDAIKDQHEDDPQARRLRLQVLTYRVAADASFAQVVVNGEVVSEFAAAGIRGLPDPPQPVAGLAVREVVVEADAGPARFLEFVQALPDPPKAQSQDGRPSLPSYVRVGLPLSPIAHFMARLAFTLSVITVAFAVGGGVLALELYRRVLGPLDHLVRTVEQVRCGDLSARAPVRSDDELGVVAGEFNRMIEALAARERRLQEVNLELTRAYQAKSEFLAMMGHEWKTPLHSIRGYCQLLLEQIDGPLNAEQIQDVEAILRAATHLIDLVDNLLHFNASAEERAVANPEPVDLTALTREAWNHLWPLARHKGLAFSMELPPQLVVEGNPLQIRQVLINLLGNAVKYTPVGGITVRGGVQDGWVWWQVEDTGIGMAPSQIAHIFEPFHRGGGRRPDVEGLGLGLAVVRQFVAAHGGRVEVESAPGKGSRFTVYWPPQGRRGL